jgi:hypothetical protein
MKKDELQAVKRMYNALMAIGVKDLYNSSQCQLDRAHEIANACLKEMNVEHTELIAKAIGIGE